MYIEDIFLASEMNHYKNTVRPGWKLDVRRTLRQEPAFFQIITKRDTSSGRIVWRLSPDLLKRSSDVILEEDILEVRIEQFPEAFNSVTQLAPGSPSSLPIGPEEALPFGIQDSLLHISKLLKNG